MLLSRGAHNQHCRVVNRQSDERCTTDVPIQPPCAEPVYPAVVSHTPPQVVFQLRSSCAAKQHTPGVAPPFCGPQAHLCTAAGGAVGRRPTCTTAGGVSAAQQLCCEAAHTRRGTAAGGCCERKRARLCPIASVSEPVYPAVVFLEPAAFILE